MYCTKCGSELPEGSRFCPRCGMEVKGSLDIKGSEEKIFPSVVGRNAEDKKREVILRVIGIIGAVLAFLALYLPYESFKGAYGMNLSALSSLRVLIAANYGEYHILLIALLVGIAICIAIRKYMISFIGSILYTVLIVIFSIEPVKEINSNKMLTLGSGTYLTIVAVLSVLVVTFMLNAYTPGRIEQARRAEHAIKALEDINIKAETKTQGWRDEEEQRMQNEQETGGMSRKNGNSESAQITIGLILILIVLMIAISAFFGWR